MNGNRYHQQGSTTGGSRASDFERKPDFNVKALKDDFSSLQTKSETIENWIKSGINKETIIFSFYFGKYFAENQLTTSQIRLIFGEMRRIQMNGYLKEKTGFLLLKPKLAYAVKRNKSTGLTKFYDFFSIAYGAVDTSNDQTGEHHFNNLINLFESVLAYHKYHGGQ